MNTCRVSQSRSRERRRLGVIAYTLMVSAALVYAAGTAQAQSETNKSHELSVVNLDMLTLGSTARTAKNFPGMPDTAATVYDDGTSETQVAPTQTPAGPTQRDIEREARKLRAGVKAGVALDPELIMLGAQVQLGPIFRSNITFRPSIEFGLGEVTALFGFNGEFIYSMPMSSAQDRWAPYFGGGLGINLIHQNFENEENGRRIDFGDFHSDSALNILGGVRSRRGVFLELRTSVYSRPSPTLRLMVGYNF